MAVDSTLWPIRATDRETVAMHARFVGASTSAPTGVEGRGVSVSRSGAGTYQVTFPTTITTSNLAGLHVQLLQAADSNLTVTAAISSGKIVLTVKDPEAGTAFTATDLSSSETCLVTATVQVV